MSDQPIYSDGARALQDLFGSRALADRLAIHSRWEAFTDADRTFLESRTMFFLATADRHGRPDCSFKGGPAGFVRVLDEHRLAFPGYDGNGMYRSFGSITENPQVGLLFIDFESPFRLRVNGTAILHTAGDLVDAFHGAQVAVEVRADSIFRNCPRYIPTLREVEASPYLPEPGRVPPDPAWKSRPEYRDVLPPPDATRYP